MSPCSTGHNGDLSQRVDIYQKRTKAADARMAQLLFSAFRIGARYIESLLKSSTASAARPKGRQSG